MGADLAQPLVGALLAFAEAMLGVGVVLPGEVMVTGIATATEGDVRIALFLAVTLGATTGDHVNYWLGRGLGDRLRDSRLVARIGVEQWEKAVAMVRRHGAWAVLVSRLLPVVRTLMAAVAGVSHVRYRSFVAASLAGSALWAALWVGAGEVVASLLGRPAVLLGVTAAALVVVVLRRVLRQRRVRSTLPAPLVVRTC